MQGKKVGNKKKLVSRLREKYRLVVMNEETFQERFSMRLNRINVLLSVLGVVLALATLFTLIVVFTPIKKFIPGYSDGDIRLHAFHSALMADSLENRIRTQELYLNNIKQVLSGEVHADSISLGDPVAHLPSDTELQPSNAMLELREQVARDEAFAIVEGELPGISSLSDAVLFTPLRGMITSGFDLSTSHFGIDIVSPKEEAVKSIMEGTVIMASWTFDTGYVIQIQHSNDLVSVYKHNAVLLKEVGDRVEGGEAIAIVGGSGEYSDGPHLHFELWSEGRPVDPQSYMVFG